MVVRSGELKREPGDEGASSLLKALVSAEPESRFALLDSSPEGLSEAVARERMDRMGANVPVGADRSNLLAEFAANFTHTLALLLWFAAGLAFAVGIPELSAAIVAVVAVNGIFAFVQEFRAAKVLEGLLEHVAIKTQVLRSGNVSAVAATDVVPGDVVELKAGDIVPADCVLISGENLSVDLSMLTGETLPADRSPEPAEWSDGIPFAEIPSVLPSGAGVVAGRGRAIVWATGAASSLGQVAHLMTSVEREDSLLERQVAALSRTTAVVAVVAGTATLALTGLTGGTSFLTALTFGTGVIVALVPEGLLPTLSVSLALAARRMAQRGAAVRRLSAVETIGSVTVICTDKTGTLTENVLKVADVTLAPGVSLREAQLAAAVCNSVNADGVAGDPFDVALWAWVATDLDPALARAQWLRLEGVPFEARRRYETVTCARGEERRRFAKGAPEALAELCGERLHPSLVAAIDAAAAAGQRVLLLASGQEGASLAPCGVVAFTDPPRAGVTEAVAACERAGIRVVMLTGDHKETARSLARTIDLRVAAVVEGHEIDRMDDRELVALLARDTVVARADPEQKIRIVQALRAAGEVVLVTGDGINDGPALRAADVGVAMGRRGTEVAKQAADIVLADDNFATIVAGIEEGRTIKHNIRRFVSYVFTSNVAEMTPFLVYIFTPVPLPLAVIQALAIDIGTDLVPALALGAEPPARGTMAAKPEPSTRPLMTRRLGLLTFFFFGVVEALIGLGGYFAFYWQGGWRPFESFEPFDGLHREAMTITFLAIVGGQAACLIARREGGFFHRVSLRGNSLAAVGIVFELVLALVLVFTPGLNDIFSMEAVAPEWLLVVPAGCVVFLAADQVRRVVAGQTSRMRRGRDE